MKTKFNLTRKIFSLMFAFFIACSVCTPLLNVSATTHSNEFEFDKTEIENDLENVDLKPYKLAGKTDIIMLVERGFQTAGDYGVWIYIYNASKATLKETTKSVVNMAIQYDENNLPISYENVEIEFCSHNIDYSVYKYRIVDSTGEMRKRAVNQNVLHGERRYDIAGVQLTKSSDGKIMDYPISKSYFYSGDMDSKDLVVNELETIELTVKPLWYRTASSSTGKNYRHQLNAVYFAIDESILQKHGKLQKVKAEWYEYKTEPIMVIQDEDVYNAVLPYVRVDIGEHMDKIPYYLGVDETFIYVPPTDVSSGSTTYNYKWGYNLPQSNSWLQSIFYTADNIITKLHYLLPTNGVDYKEYKVSSETLSNYIFSYNKTSEKGFLPVKNGAVSADLFSHNVDKGRTKGYNLVEIDADEKFDLLSYDQTHNLWKTICDYGLIDVLFGNVPTDENIENVEPIYQVKDSDLKNASQNLLIDEALLPEFKNDYNVYSEQGKKTFIFRFATTDYYSAEVSTMTADVGYMAQETVFLDFDIISLTFRNDVGDTVIPVVSSPIDIVPGIDPPLKYPTPWWIYMAIIGGGAILGFILSIVLKGEGR